MAFTSPQSASTRPAVAMGATEPTAESGSLAPDNAASTVMALLETRRSLFLAYIVRRTGEGIQAEDIFQSFAATVVMQVNRGVVPDRPLAWLYRILHSHVVDHFRREAARKRALDAFEQSLAGDEMVSDTDHPTGASPCACLFDAIDRLPVSQAAIVREVALGGVHHDTAATRHGVSAQAVTARLHRARLSLKRLLAETCAACCPADMQACSCAGEKKIGRRRHIRQPAAS